jgi:acyl-coenzyme A synthetase/AMP-(fatty) acid ligase
VLAHPDVLGAAVVGAPDRHVCEVPVLAAVTRIAQTQLEQHRLHGQVATRLGGRPPHAAGRRP